jgi:hydrogenase nickel incorporation protein HypB
MTISDDRENNEVKNAPVRIPVVQNILSANEQTAQQNREYLAERGITAINLMASPGAGKTMLLMATIAALDGLTRIGVIEGDVASQVDAEKIAAMGTPVVQINTGGGCHLDAPMIANALDALAAEVDLLFIENVGNLICPVSFDLGEKYRVALLSAPEGHDKPYKYPGIFEAVDLVIVTKIDLAPYVDFDLEKFRELVHGLNVDAPVIALSAKTGEGMTVWLDWLLEHVGARIDL